MITEDKRKAQARVRATEQGRSTIEQVTVLIMGTVALLGFLLV